MKTMDQHVYIYEVIDHNFNFFMTSLTADHSCLLQRCNAATRSLSNPSAEFSNVIRTSLENIGESVNVVEGRFIR
jgi:hypothetical protein